MDDSSTVEWVSIADLMSGLMMVFLLISLLFINEAQEKIKSFEDTKSLIYADLIEEFESDLTNWGAEIDKETLSLRFNEPEILFQNGSYELSSKFIIIIDSFFPRYINILNSEKYADKIEEIRIEGHTSSKGMSGQVSEEEKYFYNLELSQSRAKQVLFKSMKTLDPEKSNWVKGLIAASGYSSSRLIYQKNVDHEKTEDEALSRRVEFKIKVKTEEIINSMDFASKLAK